MTRKRPTRGLGASRSAGRPARRAGCRPAAPMGGSRSSQLTRLRPSSTTRTERMTAPSAVVVRSTRTRPSPPVRRDGRGVDDATADLASVTTSVRTESTGCADGRRDEAGRLLGEPGEAVGAALADPGAGPAPTTGPSKAAHRTRSAGPGLRAAHRANRSRRSGARPPSCAGVPLDRGGAPSSSTRPRRPAAGPARAARVPGAVGSGERHDVQGAGDEGALQRHLVEGCRVGARRSLPGLQDDVLGAGVASPRRRPGAGRRRRRPTAAGRRRSTG